MWLIISKDVKHHENQFNINECIHVHTTIQKLWRNYCVQTWSICLSRFFCFAGPISVAVYLRAVDISGLLLGHVCEHASMRHRTNILMHLSIIKGVRNWIWRFQALIFSLYYCMYWCMADNQFLLLSRILSSRYLSYRFFPLWWCHFTELIASGKWILPSNPLKICLLRLSNSFSPFLWNRQEYPILISITFIGYEHFSTNSWAIPRSVQHRRGSHHLRTVQYVVSYAIC